MLLRVTFSSYNSFLFCVFFPERLGPKARFSDYNVSPFTPFFISQNTRNVCNLCPSQMWTCRCLLPLRKSLALLQQGRLRKMNREAWSPLLLNATCFLWPLLPAPLSIPPPLSASIQLWCGFMASCWSFQMPLLMFALLFFGDQRGPSFFSKLWQQPRRHSTRNALCTLHR